MKKIGVMFAAVLALLCGCVTKTVSDESVSLYSRTWVLELGSLSARQKSWAFPEQLMTLKIGSDAKVSGCSGVNRYFGTARSDAEKGTLVFGNLGSTRMAGPGLEYENEYLRALGECRAYRVVDGKLYLLSGEGKTIAVFQTE